MKFSDRLFFFFKFFLSFGIIAAFFLWGRVDWGETWQAIRNVNVKLLILAACFHILGLLFSSIRWKNLLAAQGLRYNITELFKFYLVGGFFNTFLPGRVGGDIMRIHDVSKKKGSHVEPTAVVLIERGSGVLTLLGLAAFVMIMNFDVGFDIAPFQKSFWISLFFLLLIVVFFVMLFHPSMVKILLNLFEKKWLNRMKPFAEKFYRAVVIYKNRRLYLFKALAAGAALQVNYVMHYYVIGLALGFQSINLAFYFFLIPVRAVLLMTPVFINGFGLREAIDIFFFEKAGISAGKAISFSWVSVAMTMVYGLIGGLVYIFRKEAKRI